MVLRIVNKWGYHKLGKDWHTHGRRAWVVVCHADVDVREEAGPHDFDIIKVVMQIHTQFPLRPQAPSQARCGLGWAMQT